MRRLLLLLPFVLVGCKPGRQAAVSNSGRVASTAEGGTYVAGVGKVGQSADTLAWSPDGKSLAISTSKGTRLWPGGRLFAGLKGPYAWSSDGLSLAGGGKGVAVLDVASGKVRPTEHYMGAIGPIRYLPDGRLLVVSDNALDILGGPSIPILGWNVLDAVPNPDGNVVWVEAPSTNAGMTARQVFAATMRVGRWDLATGKVSYESKGRSDALLAAVDPGRIAQVMNAALSPNGVDLAVAGTVLDSSSRTIQRLLDLGDHASGTLAERREHERLLRSAKGRTVVVRVKATGERQEVWSTPLSPAQDRPDPVGIAWSANGRWLAIAQKGGTARVRLE